MHTATTLVTPHQIWGNNQHNCCYMHDSKRWEKVICNNILCIYLHHRLVGVMSRPVFVCLFVSRITQKSHVDFQESCGLSRISGVDILWTTEELIKFWKWSEIYSGYFSTFVGSPLIDWCDKWSVAKFRLTYLLLGSNNTVMISVLLGGGMHFVECSLVYTLVSYTQLAMVIMTRSFIPT